jgi:hypothetical protein
MGTSGKRAALAWWRCQGRSQMQRRYTNVDELSLAEILGDRVRSQRDITEPLPPRWRNCSVSWTG